MVIWTLACGSASNWGQATTQDVADLMPYEGQLRSLFDDGLDMSVFGADAGTAAGAGRAVRDLVRLADWISPTVVKTASAFQASSDAELELDLVLTEAPLQGSPQSEDLHVTLSRSSVTFPLAHGEADSLVGRRVILFFRLFDDQGRAVGHWHIRPDNPTIRSEIARVQAMQELTR